MTCGEDRGCAPALVDRTDLAVPIGHASRVPAAFNLQIESATAPGAVVVGRPGVSKHVCAQIRDAGADLEPIEQQTDRVACQCLSMPVPEERRILALVTEPYVCDVVVELLHELDRDCDLARVYGLADSGSDGNQGRKA